MKKRRLILLPFITLLALAFPGHTLYAQGVDGNDWDDHWLAAACPIVQGSAMARIVETALGPAVEFRGKRVGEIVLYCNVEPDSFATSFVMWAQDDSADGVVEASMYRQQVQFNQGLLDELPEPEALVTVQSRDGKGVRAFQATFDPLVDESQYMYYVKIVLARTSRDAFVQIHNVNWMVLF